ncbi:MAG: ABC transporter permease [Gammaproteobacteria bacterium]|nr:ABC transporter permease [Gammaproteobacteria bacterium]
MLPTSLLQSPIRSLIRKPGFALTVILILALGIGANTATLSLLYRYFYAPMPYARPGQLVELEFLIPGLGASNAVSVPAYQAFHTRASSLQDGALFEDGKGLNLLLGNQTLRVQGIACTASLFSTLGASPLLGRVFTQASENPDSAPEIILSYQMWTELLARDPHIIGRTLQLNGRLYTVVGVMPKSFWFPTRTSLFWVPLPLTQKDYTIQYLGKIDYNMIGRLANGADRHQLYIQTNALMQQLIARVPKNDRAFWEKNPWRTASQVWRSAVVGNYSQSLVLMQLATGLLILLAWFNLANLFVTRALARRGELVLRRILGVSGQRLFYDLLAESLVLCLVGALAGLFLGHLLLLLLQQSGLLAGSTGVPLQNGWISAAIACLFGLLSSLVFAAAGFYFVRHEDLSQALRDSDARASHGRGERRVRAVLVVLQVALACGLTGMGFMLARSLFNLNSVNLGFRPQQVLTFQVDLPANSYTHKHMVSSLSELHQAIGGITGVSAVTIASHLPFDNSEDVYNVFPHPWDQRTYNGGYTTIVDGDYFRALGMSLLAGRSFTPQDTSHQQSVAVIDTLAAQRLFGTTQVLGRELSYHGPDNTQPDSLFKVIGVVDNMRRAEVSKHPQIGSIYVDRKQVLGFDNTWWSQNQWRVAIRTPLSATRLLPQVRETLASVLPGIPIYRVRTLKQSVADSLIYMRGLAVLVAFFSVSALLLAAVGLYAVQSYAVRQRTREFGTRAALGADRPRLLRLVLSEAGRLLTIGLVLGLAGMAVIGEIFSSILYGVNPLDPLTLLAISMVLALALLLAAWMPAWRASRVPPAVALRQE